MEFYLIPDNKYAEFNIDNIAKEKKIKIKPRKNNKKDTILMHCNIVENLNINKDMLNSLQKVKKDFFDQNNDWAQVPEVF